MEWSNNKTGKYRKLRSEESFFAGKRQKAGKHGGDRMGRGGVTDRWPGCVSPRGQLIPEESSRKIVFICNTCPLLGVSTITKLWMENLTRVWLSQLHRGFPHSSVGKESACNAGDPGSIPVLGRYLGEGIGYLLQYLWLPFWLGELPSWLRR